MCDVEKIIESIKKKEHLSDIKFFNGQVLPCFIEYGDESSAHNTFEDDFLYIYVDYNEIILGPIFSKVKVGCPSCFKERRSWNKKEYEYRDTAENVLMVGEIKVNPTIIANLVNSLLKRNMSSESKTLFYYKINWENNVNLYSFWPVHSCSCCMKEELEDDIAEIEKAFEKNLTLNKYESYYPPYDHLKLDKVLSNKNTDSNFFIHREYSVQKFFSVSSYFRLKNKDYYGIGIGSGTNLDTTLHSSYFEAFERYGGMHPRGREKGIIFSSFEELGAKEAVVDPNLFLKDVTGTNKDLIFYTEKTKTNWIKTFSWKDKGGSFIPESFAYYKLDENYSGNEYKIFKGCSNGNALGGTILDSIYYACMEIIERDAFLNHWYLQHSPKRIDIPSIENNTIKILIKKLDKLGYKVSLYDIRIEEEIPTVWAYCEGQTERQFATYSTAATNHNPISAVLSALHEMLLALEYYNDGIEEIRKNALKIKEVGVKELTDHPILYSLESEKYLFDFLQKDSKSYSVQELYAGYFTSGPNERINLTYVVKKLLDSLSSRFGDVFIIRQTPLGYKKLDLELVKILIPNTQQLWFGKTNRMVSSTRIKQVMKFWGCQNQKLNSAPHPFP